METERRKFTRFLVSENVYAALGPSFSKVGRIKDISIGGLAMEYITDEDSNLKTSYVDVFIRGEEFYLSKLPCKIIYDVPLSSAGPQALGLTHKRCGVQFYRFTSGLTKRLEDFLKGGTIGVTENHIP
jgi:hypothetical protein